MATVFITASSTLAIPLPHRAWTCTKAGLHVKKRYCLHSYPPIREKRHISLSATKTAKANRDLGDRCARQSFR